MADPVKSLPTQGHILTALDYAMLVEQVNRNGVPPGTMFKFPWEKVPAGYLRCRGGQVDPAVYPRLAKLTGGRLPDDPESIIKL